MDLKQKIRELLNHNDYTTEDALLSMIKSHAILLSFVEKSGIKEDLLMYLKKEGDFKGDIEDLEEGTKLTVLIIALAEDLS